MKKIMLFVLISALLATSMTSCNVDPKEDEVIEDEVVEDEVIEDEVSEDEILEDEIIEDEVIEDEVSEEENLQPKYNIIYTPSDEIPAVSPKELQLFRDENTRNYGYKTEAGEIIIPAIFYDATAFHEELAAVYRKDGGPLEYIDASGKTILTIEGLEDINAISYYGFQPPCIFNDGVAVIYDGFFCIDKNGNKLNIKNPEGMYKCGLIAVRDPKTNLMGYANFEGNIVIPCKYKWARDFEPQGVALVFSEETIINTYGLENNLRGYINTNGEEIIPLEYYDRPDCGASYIHPIHIEVDGMIELYKDGFYHYFTYDGTLIEKSPDPRPDSE